MCVPGIPRPRTQCLTDQSMFHGLRLDDCLILEETQSSKNEQPQTGPLPNDQQQRHNHQQQSHPHLVVQHNYHDRSQEKPPTNVNHEDLLALKSSATAPFPIKLFEMLERVEEEGIESHIISWQPHGRCFVIHHPQEFAQLLLPRFFNLNKMASFQRQLNLYGFGRITQGTDKGGYYHEYFLRGKGFLAYKIQRIKVKGTGVRAKANPEQEPNLWLMPWLGNTTTTAILSTQQTLQIEPNSKPEQHQQEIWSGNDQLATKTNHPILTNTSFYSADVVLMAWGMPFHALDVLAVEDHGRDLQQPISSSCMETARNCSEDDSMYLDDVLDRMLQEFQDSNNGSRNELFGQRSRTQDSFSCYSQISSSENNNSSTTPKMMMNHREQRHRRQVSDDLASILERLVSTC